MPPIWKPQSIEVYEDWYNAILLEAEENLTDWERNFLDSIHYKLLSKRILTERQAEVLERIYTEKTK